MKATAMGLLLLLLDTPPEADHAHSYPGPWLSGCLSDAGHEEGTG